MEDICQKRTSRHANVSYKGGTRENDWILQTGLDGKVEISIWYTSVTDDMEEWKGGGEAKGEDTTNKIKTQNPNTKPPKTFIITSFFLPYFIKYMNRDDLWSMCAFFIS